MTDPQPKIGQPPSELSREFAGHALPQPERQGRSGGEAIKAGLSFLETRWQDGRWQESGGSDVWVTACVLARLAELPSEYKSQSLQRKIESSLDWLIQMRSPQGCWGARPGEDDGYSTAWAVVALRGHRRVGKQSALEFLRSCRQFDGGFAACPAESSGRRPSVPEITAVAVSALGQLDWATEDFLAASLRCQEGRPTSVSRQASRLLVCCEILDWREGMASASLLNQVRQLAVGCGNEDALERGLLLRCLLRLRMQRAWSLAAGLRAMQSEDGSWSEHDDQKIIATVTAVSALVLGESQPGLYFGSDLPLARRLHQS